jgi:hypothetical protein
MMFDLFYNQFVQVIDSVELAGGAIFRTILTDYNLPDWSPIRISWKLLESNPSSNPLCRATFWKVTDHQNGCQLCCRRSAGRMSKERKVTSGKAPYWLCIWPTFFGYPRLASRHVLQPYKRSISIGDHAFSTRL